MKKDMKSLHTVLVLEKMAMKSQCSLLRWCVDGEPSLLCEIDFARFLNLDGQSSSLCVD